MNGDGPFYLACAVMLLALPGCTHGSSVAVLANDSYAMAVPNDDLSPGERDYREADFGLDDPGVTVITADKGGSIPSYERKFFGAGTDNTRWVVDGYCNSACTMVLGPLNQSCEETVNPLISDSRAASCVIPLEVNAPPCPKMT